MEKWQAEIATDLDKYVTENYDPVINRFLSKFERSQKGDQQMVRNMAASGVEQAFAQAQPAQEQGMANRGVDPNSGQGIGLMSEYNNKKATAKARGMNTGDTGAVNNFLSNSQSLVAKGKGQQADTVRGIGLLADQQQRQAITDARSAAAARAGLTRMVGTAVGYGIGDQFGPQIETPTTSSTGIDVQQADNNFGQYGVGARAGDTYEDTLRQSGLLKVRGPSMVGG